MDKVKGQEADQSEIVELIPALRAFARTFCTNPFEADDLVQETLTKAIAHLNQYQPGTKLKSWLFTIMRNSFTNEYRKRIRERPGAVECTSSQSFVEAGQSWTLQAKETADALSRLPPIHQQVLTLIAVLGISYEDAAHICGCPIGTIKSRLKRARTALLDELGEVSAQSAIERVGQMSDHQLERHSVFVH